MRRTILAALLAVGLAAPAVAPVVARADVSVTFDQGTVGYGYNDGYWDRHHAWHPWPNDQARTEWREHNAQHYYDKAHTAYPNQGWRTETWWGH